MYSTRGWKNSAFTISLVALMFCVIAQVLGVPPSPKKKKEHGTGGLKKPSNHQKRPPKKVVAFPEMVQIPAGTFQMGSHMGDERPIHRVTLASFSMSKYEVTVGQYEAYCNARGKQMPVVPDFNPAWSKKDCPIVNVSWEDVKGYCRWLSEQTDKSYDLPTEAEWEYASRGGIEGKEFPWGDTWDASKCANTVGTNIVNITVKVGSYPANGYGLHDMSGNVWEWCKDWYGAKYYNSSPSNNPQGPTAGEYKVLRGGSLCFNNPNYFRCATRNKFISSSMYIYYGFRPVFH